MYKDLGLQLYSVRNHMTDAEGVKETFRRLGEIGYTEAQTAGAFPADCPAELFAKYANDAGIKIIGTHYGFPENIDEIDEYVALGTTNAGVGGGAYGNTLKQLWNTLKRSTAWLKIFQNTV